jgi:hypothetical protein
MKFSGNLRKMAVQLAEPVQYLLRTPEQDIDMNDLIGHELSWKYSGLINCKVCGRKTKKAFAEGLCYPCFRDAPENSPCIIKPELCEGHEGKGRDPEWEKKHHVQPHVVYLAIASGLKVGVTRQDQVPIRWIDQGAWKAIRLAEVPYRRIAGEIEVSLKQYLSDKTSWQRMLKNQLAEDLDPVAEKQRVRELLDPQWLPYYSDNDEVTEILYPVEAFPTKVKSINLDKRPEGKLRLLGIKGQYLLFEEGQVMNIRRHTGYWVDWEA